MNEWLKKVTSKLKELWGKWKPLQKAILIGIIIIVIVAIVAAAKMSSKPSTVKIFTSAVTDPTTLSAITTRIDEEGITCYVNDGIISVDDEKTAVKVRQILLSENLVPQYVDPFADFYKRDWSTTDADQLVKLNNALTAKIQELILTVEGVRDAKVIIVRPEEKLFSEDQKAVTASVQLRIDSRSDLATNTKKIKGIQQLVLNAVEGLYEENLVITDSAGEILNNFTELAESNRIDNIAKQQKLIHKLEIQYMSQIKESLQKIYTTDRIRDLNLKIAMNMSERTVEKEEFAPIQKKADNPATPYDDSEYLDYLPRSFQTTTEEWQSKGVSPEGPAGTESNTPPSYLDNRDVVAKQTKTGVTQNNELNKTHTFENSSPIIESFSVSVNVDGLWKKVRNPDTGKPELDEYGSIKRVYIAPTAEDLNKVRQIIEGAIGYDSLRGDVIRVTDLQIDRTAQFEAEDAAYFATIRRQRTILLVLVAVAVVLVGFVLFRVISRELERRRREKEARLLAEQQAARERQLWEAKDDGMEVTMSVEETRRMELQENAITMAKEHPEDVAMLIRTWLMEE